VLESLTKLSKSVLSAILHLAVSNSTLSTLKMSKTILKSKWRNI